MKLSLKRHISFIVFVTININCFAQACNDKHWMIKFTGYQTKLSKEASVTLDSVSEFLKNEPGWNIKISYGFTCERNSRKNGLIWDRANLIVTTLVRTYGIRSDRFILVSDDHGADLNKIQFTTTSEEIDLTAPPHPNLRKKNAESPGTPDGD